MKFYLQFVTVLTSAGINKAAATDGCSTDSLTKPDHWKGWDCRLPRDADRSDG